METSRDDILGRCLWDLCPDTVGTPFETELRRAVAEQKPRLIEYYYPTRNRWYENRLHPMADGLSIYFTEITDRKQAEERMAADLAGMKQLQVINTKLVLGGDPNSLLGEFVDAAIAITAADMGKIQRFEPEAAALEIVASRGFKAPFLEFFKAVHAGERYCCGAALQSGERVVIEDVTTSQVFAGTTILEVLLDAGVRRVQSTPLVGRSGSPE